MARRYKKMEAGPLVREVLYSCPEPRDTPRVRAEKSKLTTAARKAMNLKSALVKLEMLIAGNFEPRDLFVTATFRDECLPTDRTAAMKTVHKFFDLLRKTRKLQKATLKYIYAVEQGNGRWHVHFLVNAVSQDFEMIRSLWDWGAQIEFEYVGQRDYATLAGYMLKEPRPNGKKGWVGSSNLSRPKVETYWIKDAAVTLQVPHECQKLEQDHKSNIYGEFTFIKYLRPWPPSADMKRHRESDTLSGEHMEPIFKGTL